MKDTRAFEERYRTLDDPPPPIPVKFPDLQTHLQERRFSMVTLHLVLMILAFVCLVLAGIGVPAVPRVNIGWLGMAFWVLAILIGRG